MPVLQRKEYTVEDIYNLPEGTRAELIDGQIYYMAPPTRRHQDIVGTLYRKIADYIDAKGGSCKTYISPFAVSVILLQGVRFGHLCYLNIITGACPFQKFKL